MTTSPVLGVTTRSAGEGQRHTEGGPGDDTLLGQKGNDNMLGNQGKDKLSGVEAGGLRVSELEPCE
jgi:Ca2+-binding RTX toxin-like protein